MKKSLIAGAGVCAVALSFAAKDPVIMRVNGVDVSKSEFEYLYNKNSQQQINPQNLDEYVEMFKLYKMKVADAKAAGLDTTASFLKEIDQYRHDLAAPYLVDSAFTYKFVDEELARSGQDAEAYHIMFFKSRDPKQNAVLFNRMDSIRKELKNGADFSEMAAKFSQDRSSSQRGGRMGFITATGYPYAFEKACYSLAEGEISDVIDSSVGYHVLKGGKKQAPLGKVEVSHILTLTKGKDEAAQAAAKQLIDSLYNIVKADPSQFAQLATKFSEDPGSARQGGLLPAFGQGQMVPEFETVSYALADGEISAPFQTSYGWHIVQRHGAKPSYTQADIKNRVLKQIENPADPRYKMARANMTAKLAKKHKASIDSKSLAQLRNLVAQSGLDSVTYLKAQSLSMLPFAKVEGKSHNLKGLVASFNDYRQNDKDLALEAFDDMTDSYYYSLLENAHIDWLSKNEPDYRNLLREYNDGTLLYDVSVKKVWDKAAKDTKGLENYFNTHREDYAWKDPHVKGFLVQAANDSVAQLVKARATELAADTLGTTLMKEFPRQVKVERVLAPKGVNAMVDNVVFGGPEVTPSNSNFKTYFMLDTRVISIPEELSDVKGLVTSDYQNELQSAWEQDLRRKYPVEVDDKVLKQVKRIGK